MITIETTIAKISAAIGTTQYQTEDIVRRIFLQGMAPAPLPETFVYFTGPEVRADYPRMGIEQLEYYARESNIVDEATLLEYIKDQAPMVFDMTRVVVEEPKEPVEPEPEPEPPVDVPEEEAEEEVKEPTDDKPVDEETDTPVDEPPVDEVVEQSAPVPDKVDTPVEETKE